MNFKLMIFLLVTGFSSIAVANPTVGSITSDLGSLRVAISIENVTDIAADGFEGCLAYMKDNSALHYVDGFCVEYDVSSGVHSTSSFDENRFHLAAKTGSYIIVDTMLDWRRADESGFAKLVLGKTIQALESTVEGFETGNFIDNRTAKTSPMPLQMIADFLRKLLPHADAQISLVDDAIRAGKSLFSYLSRSKKTLIEIMQQGVDEAYDVFRTTGLGNTSLRSVSSSLHRAFNEAVERTGCAAICAEGANATAQITMSPAGTLVIYVMGK